ncbi:MAG: hypothetical protein M3498_07175 [Deinococcota bacterium]|jgi:hypothetical protein|nr:hypothetical protein [Deinococcota bacterium]
MITIDTVATVTPEGKLVIELPAKIAPGEHRVVVVIDTELKTAPLELPTANVGLWPEDLSLSREDLYGDDGR